MWSDDPDKACAMRCSGPKRKLLTVRKPMEARGGQSGQLAGCASQGHCYKRTVAENGDPGLSLHFSSRPPRPSQGHGSRQSRNQPRPDLLLECEEWKWHSNELTLGTEACQVYSSLWKAGRTHGYVTSETVPSEPDHVTLLHPGPCVPLACSSQNNF